MQLNFNELKMHLPAPYKAGAEEGMRRIVAESNQNYPMPKAQLAYVLATAWHESAGWMQPVREGAWRYGPNYTDANAIAAVNSLYAKGMIHVNYALPDKVTHKSYYGRGLVQITWHDNYKAFGDLLNLDLVNNPDLALEWPVTLKILFIGMRDGLFRQGHSLAQIKSPDDWFDARDIINSDKRKNGMKIATTAAAFYAALN